MKYLMISLLLILPLSFTTARAETFTHTITPENDLGIRVTIQAKSGTYYRVTVRLPTEILRDEAPIVAFLSSTGNDPFTFPIRIFEGGSLLWFEAGKSLLDAANLTIIIGEELSTFTYYINLREFMHNGISSQHAPPAGRGEAPRP